MPPHPRGPLSPLPLCAPVRLYLRAITQEPLSVGNHPITMVKGNAGAGLGRAGRVAPISATVTEAR